MVERKQPISFKFGGPISPDSIDVKGIISALQGYNRISEKAARSLYGDSVRATVRLEYIRRGSIDIGGLVEIINQPQQIIPVIGTISLGIKDIAELIKTWLDILKFLRGEPPKSIDPIPSSDKVIITNNGGQTLTINGNVYNNCIFNNIGKDAEKLTPPFSGGATKLDIRSGNRRISTYNQEDIRGFREIKPIDKPIESEINAILVVKAPILEGEGRWHFKYGSQTLTASIMDHDFLERVHSGSESFRKGDRFLVQLKSTQLTDRKKSAVRHEVMRIIRRID